MRQGASDPEKVFDRTANLENTQIINYRVDAAEKWCVLIGIAPGAAERCVHLLILTHAVCGGWLLQSTRVAACKLRIKDWCQNKLPGCLSSPARWMG